MGPINMCLSGSRSRGWCRDAAAYLRRPGLPCPGLPGTHPALLGAPGHMCQAHRAEPLTSPCRARPSCHRWCPQAGRSSQSRPGAGGRALQAAEPPPSLTCLKAPSPQCRCAKWSPGGRCARRPLEESRGSLTSYPSSSSISGSNRQLLVPHARVWAGLPAIHAIRRGKSSSTEPSRCIGGA